MMNRVRNFIFVGLSVWINYSSQCSCWSPKDVASRRQTLCAGAGALSTTFFPRDHHQKDWAVAAGPANPAEAVRRSAANIPGYGQTDVFYPQTFLGNWKAVREILPTTAGGTGSGLTLEYPIRFIRSIEDNAGVADR